MVTGTPLSPEDFLAIRRSSTMLSWKRMWDMPPQLQVEQGRIHSSRHAGVRIFYSAVFPSVHTKLRGIVCFLHGLNEHSSRYFHLFEDLCIMGFGVVAHDLRSHGQTNRDIHDMHAHVDSFQSLVDDANDVLAFTRHTLIPRMTKRGGAQAKDASKIHAQDTSTPTVPLLLMGMSLGSLVALHTALSGAHDVHGIVLMAPAVCIQMTPVLHALRFFSAMLSWCTPTMRLVRGVDEKWICRDPLFRKDYETDHLAQRLPITCRMGAEVMNAMLALQADPRVEEMESAFCQLPVLTLMGSDDIVTSRALAQHFHARIANHDKQFVVIDGAYHALVEDMERARVIEELRTWLQTRYPPV